MPPRHHDRITTWVVSLARSWSARRRRAPESERGDVPGWVLITIMTAGIVTVLWQFAGPTLQTMLETALSSVTGP